ncbi:hypothetical protein CC80DRAFT_552623 [Byssothecium circinans]|uniref:Uncharacterized protein n=1 Tax=Byssothecium circinans TaxID=147558 RepID=A0A6A5TKH9_9PLEO|nr:hypothetical protein CC80DRAFT_552623 [Byssothecium circinans]
MGEETLVTFLFDCPTAVRTVELLGSWDNFAKSYKLQRDRRRGHGIWSGCYTFDGIICDGDLKNLGRRRSGALKMGGTYWYYYKVDDEEHHNPSEPSTATCPLLPGQRLNVLEVPTESRSRSSSGVSDSFTRNPQDKFLTPVPPKPLPSPRLGDFCREAYTVPMRHCGTPQSATYPSTSQSLAPSQRHARSASTSPSIPTTALFSDFRSLKEKFAQKRSAPVPHCRSDSTRGLQIGAPTLISTTADDLNLIPLSALWPPQSASNESTPASSSSLPAPITAKLREFSPLGSNPVDPVNDLNLCVPARESQGGRPRSRSNPTESSLLPESRTPSIVRANSSDIRRTKIFSDQPWVASPKPPQPVVEVSAPELSPAPVLQRLSASLEPPTDVRPTSSHGDDRSPSLRKGPLDTNKQLPTLPRFLVPAPLFACNSEALSPQQPPVPGKDDKPEQKAAKGEPEMDDSKIHLLTERNSHSSLWSVDSFVSSSPTSDDEAAHSPTFSSLTSNCSVPGSPRRPSSHFSISDYMSSPDHNSAAFKYSNHNLTNDDGEHATSTSPPLLDDLRLSTFGPCMFLDIQHGESRRQAACFGYGNSDFQGYKLPEDETTSKTTITIADVGAESVFGTDSGEATGLGLTVGHQDKMESSVIQMERLVDEFGFLGDAVV